MHGMANHEPNKSSSCGCIRHALRRPRHFVLAAVSLCFLVYFVPPFKANSSPWVADKTTPLVITQRDKIMSERSSVTEHACRSNTNTSLHIQEVFVHEQLHIAYCPVAKIGSTFWKRIFLFLSNDTFNLRPLRPFDIPRKYAHYAKRVNTKVVLFNETKAVVNKLVKFMFVRDPYARLWSAYIDKFFLPDFWRSYARLPLRLRHRTTIRSKLCRNDVTFGEFLKYVTSIKDPMKMNEHWRPVAHVCDPCQFRPDIIGRMESFLEDSNFILGTINQTQLMTLYNHEEHVIEEITSLADYNFDLLNKPFYKQCLSSINLAKRLWRAFQLNGYLPYDVDIGPILDTVPDIDAKTFKTLVLTVRQQSESSLHRWRKSRYEAMYLAYHMVDKDVLKRVAEIFHWDFVMFGYTKWPTQIFGKS